VDAAAEGRKLDGEGAQEKEVTSSPAATCFSKQLSLSRLQPDLGRRRAAPIYTPHNNDNNMMCVRVRSFRQLAFLHARTLSRSIRRGANPFVNRICFRRLLNNFTPTSVPEIKWSENYYLNDLNRLFLFPVQEHK